MALGMFLVSAFVAIFAAIATGLSGGTWLAVIGWGIGTAWLSVLVLAGMAMARSYLTSDIAVRRSNRPVSRQLAHRPS
ncbi:hypothetical protein [Tropicimonas marinistellae]|uniref:hypothetical protein n=1 Tax=Tropicimonas marinistellae TaxID=1739787 RepID=UPI0008326012|nr:hypothetical protein [Tropicimonas marinistellae]